LGGGGGWLDWYTIKAVLPTESSNSNLQYICTLYTVSREKGRGSNMGEHCKENPIYVFLFWELRGLSSMSDLYIPRIGPHISLQLKRQTDGNI
jgi:hypothetical protein